MDKLICDICKKRIGEEDDYITAFTRWSGIYDPVDKSEWRFHAACFYKMLKKVDEMEAMKKQSITDKYYYMTPDALVMYIIPKELIKKYGCRKLTGGHAKSISAFEIGTRSNTKEPQVKHTAKATYRTDELMKFLKVATMLGAEHVTISLATDEAVKITARNEEGEEVSFWLAAYVKD